MGHEPLEPNQTELVLDAADVLRLRDDIVPAQRAYDVILILGGLVRACLARVEYAHSLAADHLVTCQVVAALTTERPLTPNEVQLAGYHGVSGATSEADVVRRLLLRTFGRDRRRRHELYRTRGGPELQVIVAAPPLGQPRASTRDTYQCWVASAEHVQRALIVTSSIYGLYQGAVAVEALGITHGLSIETVGTAMVAGPFMQEFGWWHYLQEMRSAVVAPRSLRRVLDNC